MRIKVVEILKFVVAVAIGFTLRVMFENSYHVVSHVKPCVITKDSDTDLSLDNIHEQLRQPHQPSSTRDVIEYRYFNLSIVFDTHLGHVKTQMKHYHRADIRDIIKQVEGLMNAGFDIRYKVKDFVNGFERIDPVRGKEYVIDLELTPESVTKAQSQPHIVRYNLVKPFSYLQMVSQTDVSPTKSRTINMIYIVNGKNAQFIKYIMAHHELHIVNLFPVNVTIYLCSETSTPVNSVQSMVNAFSAKFKSVVSYKLNLIIKNACQFHAAAVTNDAVNTITDTNSRIVVLDINVNVTHIFLQRCSSVLTENVNNVYVPIPFAGFLHGRVDTANELSEETGVWDHDNYEVVCMHKTLFTALNGLKKDTFISEAYKFFIDQLIKMKKQVFRSTDPSVTVFYHNIKCKDQIVMKYSNKSYCEDRQRLTFQSKFDSFASIKLD